jgi:hypothetical protein
MFIRFDIVEEPRGAVYLALLEAMSPIARRASLIIAERDKLTNEGRAVLEALPEDGLERRIVNAWPGTQLDGGSAQLLVFSFQLAKLLLQSAAGGLYDWVVPNRPEDLALYRGNSEVCLLSCAHEQFAELFLSIDEMEALRSRCPTIRCKAMTDTS